MEKVFEIEGTKIGEGQKCYTIAEIASNHNRDKETVRKLIDASVEAGFDAVKFQIYDAEEAFSKNVTTGDVNYSHFYVLHHSIQINLFDLLICFQKYFLILILCWVLNCIKNVYYCLIYQRLLL